MQFHFGTCWQSMTYFCCCSFLPLHQQSAFNSYADSKSNILVTFNWLRCNAMHTENFVLLHLAVWLNCYFRSWSSFSFFMAIENERRNFETGVVKNSPNDFLSPSRRRTKKRAAPNEKKRDCWWFFFLIISFYYSLICYRFASENTCPHGSLTWRNKNYVRSWKTMWRKRKEIRLELPDVHNFAKIACMM